MNGTFLTRRQFVGWSAALAAVSSQMVQRATAMPGHQAGGDAMMDWQAFTDQPLTAFTEAERQLVAALVDTIIPRTDTPGAVDANVHAFVELIYANWMNESERDIFKQGLSEITAREGESFILLNAADRREWLEDLEQESGDHPWFNLGYEADDLEMPFIAQLKELTTVGFFMSEKGATEVLRHNHFPGYFEGDIPLGPGESTWATTPLV